MASMSGVPDQSVTLNATPADRLDLSGRKLVIVGGTDGLGRAIALLAASRGAFVTVVGRTFRDESAQGLSFMKADLSSMKAAAQVGRELGIDGVDTFLFTTGIFAAPERQVTAEGLERDMAVSYLSRLAIVRELAPRLEAAKPSRPPRLFIMGFPGTGQRGDAGDLNAERSYKAMDVHMNTVAGNEMLVLDGVRRYPSLRFFGLNPGLIKTNIRSNFLGEGSLKLKMAELVIGLLTQSAQTYARRMLPVLYASGLDGKNGVMVNAKAMPILPSEGLSEPHVKAFIEGSQALVERALRA
jgi:NAD(P)-dependent dehydrogenase (short-subunit alcohol dehydrogenase family)